VNARRCKLGPDSRKRRQSPLKRIATVGDRSEFRNRLALSRDDQSLACLNAVQKVPEPVLEFRRRDRRIAPQGLLHAVRLDTLFSQNNPIIAQ
jgi:hypothetical protein